MIRAEKRRQKRKEVMTLKQQILVAETLWARHADMKTLQQLKESMDEYQKELGEEILPEIAKQLVKRIEDQIKIKEEVEAKQKAKKL